MAKTKSPTQCWLSWMPKKDIPESGQAGFSVLVLLDLEQGPTEVGLILRTFMYHHQNGLKVEKAAKATVVAALAIWKKGRMDAHFVEHVQAIFRCLQDPDVA